MCSFQLSALAPPLLCFFAFFFVGSVEPRGCSAVRFCHLQGPQGFTNSKTLVGVATDRGAQRLLAFLYILFVFFLLSFLFILFSSFFAGTTKSNKNMEKKQEKKKQEKKNWTLKVALRPSGVVFLVTIQSALLFLHLCNEQGSVHEYIVELLAVLS